MPSQAGATADALTSVAEVPVALPATVLTVLADYAMAEPACRVPLCVALLGRPDTPPDLAARLAAGTPGVPAPPRVQVAYLLRAEHTVDDLREAFTARRSPTVLRALAASEKATGPLLEVLADCDDPTATCDVLAHPNTPAAARLVALAHLDDMANEAGMRDRRHDRYAEFASAIRRGLAPELAETVASTLTNPVLLAAAAYQHPLSDPAYQRVIDVCLSTPLAGGRTNSAMNLVELVVAALNTNGSAAARQHAADVLIEHDIDRVDGRPTLMALGLAPPPQIHVTPLAERGWTFAATTASTSPEVAAALADALLTGLGTDSDRWRTFTALAGTFPGTVGDLITTAAAVTTPAPST